MGEPILENRDYVGVGHAHLQEPSGSSGRDVLIVRWEPIGSTESPSFLVDPDDPWGDFEKQVHLVGALWRPLPTDPQPGPHDPETT